MKTRLIYGVFLLLIFFSGTTDLLAGDKLPEPFLVIPQPANVVLLDGQGIEFGTLKYLQLYGEIDRPVMGDILSTLPEKSSNDKATPERTGFLSLEINTKPGLPSEEAYILTILEGNVKIEANADAGLFYACQTLEQLLEDARDFNVSIPACKITDSPVLSYRAVHFDVKHHLDHMNYYYESIDRLARYKINAIIFEFEDKLRYERQPLVGAPHAISIDEMAALTEYARKRHIEVSPLVQGLGHATFILKHEEYSYLRELKDNHWAFCPLHEGCYQVLFDLYRDAMDATPGSKYLHIGGDEIGNIGLCPRCKPFADEKGLFALNLYWLNRVSEFIVEQGRIPIFWDDMPLKYAGVMETASTRSEMEFEEAKAAWDTGSVILDKLIRQYPKECVFMRWNYSMATQPGNIMTMEWYKKNDIPTMISTAANSGGNPLLPYDQRDRGVVSRGPIAIKSFIELAAEMDIDGCLTTAWDDRSPHMETFWRGFIASGEYCWSPGKRDLDEFDQAYLRREYGTTIPEYFKLYHTLEKGVDCWNTIFLKNGQRDYLENALIVLPGFAHWLPPRDPSMQNQVDYEGIIIDLPDPDSPGTWSKKYEQRLKSARQVLADYESSSKIINGLYLNSLRNRYHWKLLSAINDFQVTAPQLMLALERCDSPKKMDREKGYREVIIAIEDFGKAWDQLMTVYSETRFLSYPSSYVPDRYFHLASQREDQTYIIQVEEYLHAEIKKWIQNNQ